MSSQSRKLSTAYIPPTSPSLTLGKRSRPISTREDVGFDDPDQIEGPSHQLKTRHATDSGAFEPGAKKTGDFHHSGEYTRDQDGSSGSVANSDTPSFRSVKYSPNFRWPFYQGGSNSQHANSDDHAEKKPTTKESNSTVETPSNQTDLTSSSKLPTRKLFPFPDHTRSIQQRWKQVVGKMILLRSTAKEGNVARDNQKHPKIATDMHLSEPNGDQSSKSPSAENQGSSVRDLYKPPPSSTDAESSPKITPKKGSWFRSPWNHTGEGHGSDNDSGCSVDNVDQKNRDGTKKETSLHRKSNEKQDSLNGQRWSFPFWKMSKNSHDSEVFERSEVRSDSKEAGKPQGSDSHKSNAPHSSASQTITTKDEEEDSTRPADASSEGGTKPSTYEDLHEESVSTGPNAESSLRSSQSDTEFDVDGKAETDLSNDTDKNRHTASVVRNTPEVTFSQRDIANIRLIFGSETFFATEAMSAPGGLIFRGNLRGEPAVTLQKLEDRLKGRFGNKYTICLAEGDEDRRPVVVVVPSTHYLRSLSPRQRLIAIAVAAMTATTCMSRGISANLYRQRIVSAYGLPPLKNLMDKLFFHPLSSAVTIACAITTIVLISQVSQRIVASFYRTRIALPFVLPSYQLGSFGAIVHVASPAPSRTALFDIAAAGTATLLIISLTCLVIGLRLSTTFSAVFPVPMSTVSGSILMGYLTKNVPNGKILVDYGQSLIGLHPLAIIGANCLTITALNLLPIRLLDGGRIMSALYGRKVGLVVSRMAVLFLLLASSRTPYLVMFLLAVSFGPWYVDRPSKNELTEPDNARTIIGYLLMLTMLGILLPYPKSAFFGTLAS